MRIVWAGIAIGSMATAVIAACTGSDPDPQPPSASSGTSSGTPPSGTSSTSSSSGTSGVSSSSGSPLDGGGPTVHCEGAGRECSVAAGEVCCFEANASAGTCATQCSAISKLACDSPDDCSSEQLCCAATVDEYSYSSSCQRPAASGDCGNGPPLCTKTDECPMINGSNHNCVHLTDIFPPGLMGCN